MALRPCARWLSPWRRLPKPCLLQMSTRTLAITARTVNPRAQAAFGKGAKLYDHARPSYQPNVLSRIRSAVKSPPPLNVAELGAGSGIFTRDMLAHPEWSPSIRRLKAIDPSEGMRKVFSETIKDNRVTVTDGVFESTGVPDGWADVVVVAQALHWARDHDAAMAESARILKPDGVLACVSIIDDSEAAKWLSLVRDRFQQYDKGTPHVRHEHYWRPAFRTPSYLKFFGSPQEETFVYTLPRTLDKVVGRVLSSSYVSTLPDDKKSKIKKDVEDIVKRAEGMVWIDESRGIFEYPLKSTLIISRRKPQA